MVYSKGIDKAELLVGLYEGSHQQGMGMSQPSQPLTVEEARELLKNNSSFDYLFGKVINVNLQNDVSFEEWLYDRDNGSGKAQSVVNGIREKMIESATTEEEKTEIMEQDRISKELYAKQQKEKEEKERVAIEEKIKYYEELLDEIDRERVGLHGRMTDQDYLKRDLYLETQNVIIKR